MTTQNSYIYNYPLLILLIQVIPTLKTMRHDDLPTAILQMNYRGGSHPDNVFYMVSTVTNTRTLKKSGFLKNLKLLKTLVCCNLVTRQGVKMGVLCNTFTHANSKTPLHLFM